MTMYLTKNSWICCAAMLAGLGCVFAEPTVTNGVTLTQAIKMIEAQYPVSIQVKSPAIETNAMVPQPGAITDQEAFDQALGILFRDWSFVALFFDQSDKDAVTVEIWDGGEKIRQRRSGAMGAILAALPLDMATRSRFISGNKEGWYKILVCPMPGDDKCAGFQQSDIQTMIQKSSLQKPDPKRVILPPLGNCTNSYTAEDVEKILEDSRNSMADSADTDTMTPPFPLSKPKDMPQGSPLNEQHGRKFPGELEKDPRIINERIQEILLKKKK